MWLLLLWLLGWCDGEGLSWNVVILAIAMEERRKHLNPLTTTNNNNIIHHHGIKNNKLYEVCELEG